MTKPEQTRLTVLLVILGVVSVFAYYFYDRGTTQGALIFVNDAPYNPIAVENPSLQLFRLKGATKVEYAGTHRNIFSTQLPPRVLTPAEIEANRRNLAPAAPVQTGPPPIPPVVVDLKFYGYVDEPRIGLRRAFFTNGDDIFIAGVGDVLEKRLRVTRIGNDTVELEEISSARHATVNIVPDDRTQGPG